MENNYFRVAGDLESEPAKENYFRVAGDLESEPAKENYFKVAGDLESEPAKDSYFRVAGDLESEPAKKSYFKVAGDLESEPAKDSYFKVAGDLESEPAKRIDDYLLTVVSGKRYPFESEMGRVVSASRTVVSLEEVKRMFDEGYNIVSAEYIGADLVSVEFQQLAKDNDMGRGR